MADSKLNVIVSVVDQFSKGFDALNKKLKSQETNFKAIATAGAIAFASVTAIVAKAVSSYQDAEVAQARLRQIATQVTGATQEQIKAFEDLASTLQKVGVIDDDTIIAGQSQIASFTKSSQVVAELSDDLADLAVAQYGVNVSQEQAIQTGNLLGKALNGNLGALTKSGILVSGEFKKAFEAANTEQERAIVLSKIIQDNYGGLNAALRNTSAGGMKALSNSIGDVWEKVGKALIPALDKLAAALVPIVDKISAWVDNNQELIPYILGAVAAISGLLIVVGTLGLAIPAITAGFAALAVVLEALPIILLISAIIAAGVLLYQNWDLIKSKAIEVWNYIVGVFTSFVNSVIEKFNEAKDTTASIFNAIYDYIIGIWNKIVTAVTFVVALLVGVIITTFEGFGLNLSDVLTGIGDFFVNFWNSLVQVVTEKINAVLSVIQIVLGGIKTVWSIAWNGITTYFGEVWATLKNYVGGGLAAMIGQVSSAAEPIKGAFGKMWDAITSTVSSAIDNLKNLVKGLINSIINAINGFIDKLNSVAAKAGSIIPGFTAPQIGKIPALATGGIVTRPTIAMIGEAGAEAVVPLNKMNQMGGTTINVTGNTFIDRRSFEDLIDEVLMSKLRKNLMPA